MSGVWDQILGASSPTPAPPFGAYHAGHLLERLGREGGTHLMVASLVPLNARDGPELREESWAVTVDGELAPVVPLDAAVASGDGETLQELEAGTVILRLTLATAEVVGKNATEWQTLEKQVRLGRWTNGPRTDEGRLRQLAAELQAPLRVGGIAVLRTRSRARTRGRGSA